MRGANAASGSADLGGGLGLGMQRSGRGELNEDLAKVWVVRGVLMEVDFGHGEMLGWWMGICSSSNSGEKNENTGAGRQWMGCSPACLLPPIRKSMARSPGSPAGSGSIASKNKGQKNEEKCGKKCYRSEMRKVAKERCSPLF